MKKILYLAIIVFTAIPTCYAYTRSGRTPTDVVPYTGDGVTFTKNTVGAGTAVHISTTSTTRAHIVCRNAGAFVVYIGSGTGVTSAGNTAYYVGEGTSTLHTFETYNTGDLYAIGSAGAGGSAAVYCQEDR